MKVVCGGMVCCSGYLCWCMGCLLGVCMYCMNGLMVLCFVVYCYGVGVCFCGKKRGV